MIKEQLLKFIGEKEVIRWLMGRTQFPALGSQDNKVLQDMFFRIPEMRAWLKQMQVRLLRSTLVEKNLAAQREGQILFIELLLANDIPSGNFETKLVAPEPETIKISRDNFLKGWGTSQKNASNSEG